MYMIHMHAHTCTYTHVHMHKHTNRDTHTVLGLDMTYLDKHTFCIRMYLRYLRTNNYFGY